MVRPVKQITSKRRTEHVSKRSPPPADSQGRGVSANLRNVELMNVRFQRIESSENILKLSLQSIIGRTIPARRRLSSELPLRCFDRAREAAISLCCGGTALNNPTDHSVDPQEYIISVLKRRRSRARS